MSLIIRPRSPFDDTWVTETLIASWRDLAVVSRGVVHRADMLPGFVAERDGDRVGLLTYHVAGERCEIVTIDSLLPRQGIGGLLIAAVAARAEAHGCRRLWLITTNDNLTAQAFYERQGFTRGTVHHGAVEQSRRLKPSIPLLGEYGVPITDEIEYEKVL